MEERAFDEFLHDERPAVCGCAPLQCRDGIGADYFCADLSFARFAESLVAALDRISLLGVEHFEADDRTSYFVFGLIKIRHRA